MSRHRRIRLPAISLSLLLLAASPAVAWGPAVHTYVADHVGKAGPLNVIEMYGAVLPDACYFAYGLTSEKQAACAAVVHEPYALWEEAFNPPYVFNPGYKALGFGYASHNNDWGADRTAHHPLWGYIVTRARFMAILLRSNELLGSLPFEAREAIAHTVLEAATDVQVRRIDPAIGAKVKIAAFYRGDWVPLYFAGVYKEPGLAGIEDVFRGAMYKYGEALAEGDPVAALAEVFEPYADNWVPGGLPVGVDAKELIIGLVNLGITLTERDFAPALRNTKMYVNWNLWLHGVWY